MKIMFVLLALVLFCQPVCVQPWLRGIVVDGDPSEWEDIPYQLIMYRNGDETTPVKGSLKFAYNTRGNYVFYHGIEVTNLEMWVDGDPVDLSCLPAGIGTLECRHPFRGSPGEHSLYVQARSVSGYACYMISGCGCYQEPENPTGILDCPICGRRRG